jgi:hypothetical protein
MMEITIQFTVESEGDDDPTYDPKDASGLTSAGFDQVMAFVQSIGGFDVNVVRD